MEAHYWSFQLKHGGYPFTPPYFSLYIICGGLNRSILRVRSLEKRAASFWLTSIVEAHWWSFQSKFVGNFSFTWPYSSLCRIWSWRSRSIPKIRSLEKKAPIFWLISIIENHYQSFQLQFGRNPFTRSYFSIYTIWNKRSRSIPRIRFLKKGAANSLLISSVKAH